MPPNIIQDLRTEGRAIVTYESELRTAVEEAVAAWRAFYALPIELKQRFAYSGDLNVSGNGYELKLNPEKGDLKEDFHLRVAVRDWLFEEARKVDDVVTPRFIEKALALNAHMTDTLRLFAESVEEGCKIAGFADDVMAKQPFWLLRFLHYFGDRQPGDIFAAEHVDKGGFTLHLYESHDGVERMDFKTREWKPLPVSHEQTAVFAGLGLQQRSESDLRALAHRVVATEESAVTGRDSVVAFIAFDNCRHWNKEKFGSTQGFPAGFFYDMPVPTFNQYFVD